MSDSRYKFREGHRRGSMLIINNYLFDSDEKGASTVSEAARGAASEAEWDTDSSENESGDSDNGSDSDSFHHRSYHPLEKSRGFARRLRSIFYGLGYHVTIQRNRTASEMKEKITAFSQSQNRKDDGSVIVMIMSHGNEGIVSGADDDKVDLEEIFGLFKRKKCPFLKDKPKMFVIEACRGSKSHHRAHDSDTRASSGGRRKRPALPEDADMLLVYATEKGYVSSDDSGGSIFARKFADVMKRVTKRPEEIRDLLQKVKDDVSEQEQIPEIDGTRLCKKWYFKKVRSRAKYSRH